MEMNEPDLVEIRLPEVGMKAQSKSEMYHALTVDAQYYLPPCNECPILFISQIIVHEKKALKSDCVKVCTIPNVEGLRSKDFIKFIIEELDGMDYLPEKFLDYTPNRAWLANIYNIGNSLDTKMFQSYVKEKLAKREQRILQKQHMTMDVDSDFAKSFKSSQMVSVKKGRSHLLLKKALIKKEKELKIEQKERDQQLLESIPSLINQINDLKRELQEKEKRIDEYIEDSELLKKLYQDGHINKYKNPVEK